MRFKITLYFNKKSLIEIMEINQKYHTEITEFVRKANDIAKIYHLVKCSSGNISWRLDDYVLLTKTGSWLADLTINEVAIVNIKSGESCNNVNPTMEKNLHLEVLKNRLDFNVVLHTQTPYATTIACMQNIPEDFNVIIETPCYLGTPAIIPYYRPGSQELALSVAESFKNHNVALLSNHGVVVGGKDFNEAIQRALFLELTCKILVHTERNRKTISKKDIDELHQYLNAKNR